MDKSHNEFYIKLNEIKLHIYSIILGVFVWYYLRIREIKEKNELKDLKNHELMNFFNLFKKRFPRYSL